MLAVAVSVGMHVTWNLIARRQPADAFPLWWVLLAHLLLLGPFGFSALVTSVTWRGFGCSGTENRVRYLSLIIE